MRWKTAAARSDKLGYLSNRARGFPPMESSGAYETGMRISYDSASKKVSVAFRGRLLTLPGEYSTMQEAVRAGEGHCRHLGWQKPVHRKHAVSLLHR